jgi:DNA-binding transcriptional ArsR family regulator
MANSSPAALLDPALDRSFAACSHPIRRGIIERLSDRELTVGEATRDFGVSKPAISKHLKVLEEAGTIVRVIDGRTHRLRLRQQSLDDAYAWIGRQRELWERKLDTVEQYLREQRANREANGQGRAVPGRDTRGDTGRDTRKAVLDTSKDTDRDTNMDTNRDTSKETK